MKKDKGVSERQMGDFVYLPFLVRWEKFLSEKIGIFPKGKEENEKCHT